MGLLFDAPRAPPREQRQRGHRRDWGGGHGAGGGALGGAAAGAQLVNADAAGAVSGGAVDEPRDREVGAEIAPREGDAGVFGRDDAGRGIDPKGRRVVALADPEAGDEEVIAAGDER